MHSHDHQPGAAAQTLATRGVAWPAWGALALSLAFVGLACVLRLASFEVARFDGDEYAFALVARDVVHGLAPNTGVFDNKPVGLTYLFALAELLGGQTVAALRVLGFLASAACSALLYRSSRSLGLDRALSASVAALFLLGGLCLGGFASMSELLAAPLLAAANHLLIAGRRSPAKLAAAGAAFGLAVQVTYLAGPCAALTALGVVLAAPQRPLLARLRDGLLMGLLMGLAGAVAAGAVWLPQLVGGDLPAYLAEQARYHHGYRRASIGWDDWRVGFALPLALMCLPILAACLTRAPRGEAARPLPRSAWILGLQVVGAALAATASNRFYPHYLILAVPAVALLAAVLLADTPAPARRGGAWALTAVLAFCAAVSTDHLRERMAAPNVEVQAAAAVDQLTRPGQPIFVFDEAHPIYFLAQRPAASRYVFPTHYLSSCDGTAPITTPEKVLDQALAQRPALVLLGAVCPRQVDAEARVRAAGYRQVREVEADGRRIGVYAPAR